VECEVVCCEDDVADLPVLRECVCVHVTEEGRDDEREKGVDCSSLSVFCFSELAIELKRRPHTDPTQCSSN
jgi:Na+-translocating ferredoxin:NAD+ oxidoreductase RnfC subunit